MTKFIFGAVALVCAIGFVNAAVDVFNFNSENGVRSSVDNWIEQSDRTVRPTGQSKASIKISNDQSVRRAVFSSELNPVNGAGFAAVRVIEPLGDLSGYSGLQIQCRGKGEFTNFKIVLRHKGLNEDPEVTYEQTFQAPTTNFGVVTLPFSSFPPYFRGQPATNAEPLDASQITVFGIQHYAGFYLENIQQHGPATLEIDWVKAV